MPSENEANIGRVAALRLGCGERVPAWTVQRNCASGMQSIDSAAQNIASGRSSLVLAGGVESMSRAPILYNDTMVHWLAAMARARTLPAKLKVLGRLRPGHFKPVIALLHGLTDPVVGLSMGQTAEILAHRFGITRDNDGQLCDAQSPAPGRCTQEGPCSMRSKSCTTLTAHVHDHDDGVRPDSSMEKLATLRPVFDKPLGNVTAGNSAQITDGAAWLILASEELVSRYNLPVLGQLVDSQWAGLDPAQMGLGPCYAMAPIMQRHGLDTPDIDFIRNQRGLRRPGAGLPGCLEGPGFLP